MTAPEPPPLPGVSHRTVDAGDVRLHVAEAGSGEPVVLVHGFPDLWFSWRRQLPALAQAGRRAIAPDMRGYGLSSAPADVEAYDVLTLAGDLVALLDALGLERAAFVGHDWGAQVVWQLARAHPERVGAVAAISVPFVPRTPEPPLAILRDAFGESFYMVWFQRPGVEEVLERQLERTLTKEDLWTPEWAAREDEAVVRPPRLTEEELRYCVETFRATGLRGGLNWYRNVERNWELTARLGDRRVEQPALFVRGSADVTATYLPVEVMDGWVTDLRGTVVVEGAGHWAHQDAPEAVDSALLDFLGAL